MRQESSNFLFAEFLMSKQLEHTLSFQVKY